MYLLNQNVDIGPSFKSASQSPATLLIQQELVPPFWELLSPACSSHSTAGKQLVKKIHSEIPQALRTESKQFQRLLASMIFGFTFGFSLFLFSLLENQFDQCKLNTLGGSGPYKSWWPFFKEVWTLVSLFAEVPEEWKMGTSVGEKATNIRAWSSWKQCDCPQGDKARQGQGNNLTKTLQGRSCGDNHLLLAVRTPRMAVNRTETQIPEYSWMEVLETLADCPCSSGSSGHDQYCSNTTAAHRHPTGLPWGQWSKDRGSLKPF